MKGEAVQAAVQEKPKVQIAMQAAVPEKPKAAMVQGEEAMVATAKAKNHRGQ